MTHFLSIAMPRVAQQGLGGGVVGGMEAVFACLNAVAPPGAGVS